MRERREQDLLRAEGRCSYMSSSFGSEVTPTPTRGRGRGRVRGRGKRTLASTRGKGIKRLLTSADSPLASTRRKGVKRHLTSADSSEPSSDTDASTAVEVPRMYVTSVKGDNHPPKPPDNLWESTGPVGWL